MENGEFILKGVETDVWYKNPVNGPTGGIDLYFESDKEGNPTGILHCLCQSAWVCI